MSTFRIQAFAKLAGVTVRTLHHYDRLGVLSPAGRSDAGYRLYTHDDLGRLERILVLRYLGLSLREIADLLAARGGDEHDSLLLTLERQARVLRERRANLDRVLRAVDGALVQAKGADETPEWVLYQSILKEINMNEQQQWTDKYYNDEAKAVIGEQAKQWDHSQQAAVTAKWQAIYAEVQSALDRGVEPTSKEGQAIAARWMASISEFTGGNARVLEGLNKMYADRSNWPAKAMSEEAKANLPKPEYMAFVRAAQQG